MINRKIIVTGGAGYIGSHTVVELIRSGFDPIIVDNLSNSQPESVDAVRKLTGKAIPFFKADCCDEQAMRNIFAKIGKVDGVIHFAAYKAVCESTRDPLKYYHNNLNSLTSLMKVMGEFEVSNLVFSSTCAVYGDSEEFPVHEDQTLGKAVSPYGHTKQICEDMIKATTNSQQALKAVTLRYFNPIGAHPSGMIGEQPLNQPSNLIPLLTQNAIRIGPELSIYGDDYATSDGTCVRDFIHVVDLAKAHIHALEWLNKQINTSFNEVFNIGTGQGNSVLEVIKQFEKVTGYTLNYKIGPRRSGDIPKMYADTSKALDILEWKPEYSLSEALNHAMNWQLVLSKKRMGVAV